jgi:hypothetical protein
MREKKEAVFPQPRSLVSVLDINDFAYYRYRPDNNVNDAEQWRRNPSRPALPSFSDFGQTRKALNNYCQLYTSSDDEIFFH